MRFARRPRFFVFVGSVALLTVTLSGPVMPATIEGTDWIPLGPAPGEFSYYPGSVSGRATAVAVNPLNSDDIWLGTAQGGIWHSTDGGDKWFPVSDNEASLAIGAIALAGCDAQFCQRVFVGTGENAIRRDTFYGQGVLVGRLEGEALFWELQTGTPYDFSYASIYNVVLDPTTSGSTTTLYITLSSGATASATESTVTAAEPAGGFGLYKSMDEANTWSKLDVPGSDDAKPTDLEMDPDDSDVLYAGFTGRGIFKSTDKGNTWCPLNPGVPKDGGCPDPAGLPDPTMVTFNHVEIAIHRPNPDILYATIGYCPDPLLAACSPGVYRSDDGGVNWTEQRPGSPTYSSGCLKSYSRYTHALAIDPADDSRVFIGGVNICRSDDAGVTFFNSDSSTVGVGNEVHSDHRQIVFHDDDPSLVFNAGDGGIARSSDSGASWTPINGNVGSFGFQSIASSPDTPRIIGGAQDNAGQMWTGSRYWEHLNCCGDGGFSIIDLDDPAIMYVTSNVGGVGDTTVLPKKSTDGGSSFLNGTTINDGLKNQDDPRSFYSPFIQDPSSPHPLYFGTNRLFRSTNDAADWTPVSPVLSTTSQTEIFALQDVITAIAVAPSDPDRIYIGYYSGKVFVTNAACANGSCWPQRDDGLPSGPVTWIAVDPDDPDTAYATFGGFFSGVHTYRTSDAGMDWDPTAAHGDLNGVPANAIAVEPGDSDRLWLGTDIGMYKSLNAGGSWFRFSEGLPNVPVFQISIDDSRGRIYAGTHGRGAFVITRPLLNNFEGWVNDSIWDIPLYGEGFLSNQSCTVKVLRQDLTICAAGSVDAQGGDIETDSDGVLVTSKAATYSGKPVAWACYNGTCVGGADIEDCNHPGNALAAVIAICGPQVGINLVSGCPAVTAPPSSWTGLTGLDDFSKHAGRFEQRGVMPSFDLIPTLHVGDGTTETMCEVSVPFSPTSSSSAVLGEARDRINAEPACAAAGVVAEIVEGRDSHVVEDLFPNPDNLKLDAPGRVGGQLIPSIRAAPGETTGLCFVMNKLGVPVSSQVRIMRTRFLAPGGAAGGDITFVERSPLGRCEINIATFPGDTATDIAQRLADASQVAGIPGPHPLCPSSANPRDISRHGDSVVTVVPNELHLCVNDSGVGFTIAPEEVCFADSDCDDGNPCSINTCNEQTGQCKTEFVDDGTSCEDDDRCTEGNSCLDGVCGQPVNCDDGNPCTDDQCTDGRCRNPQVECDDGNVCTRNFCDQSTGDCLTEPLTAGCDDGNLCTVGDVCVPDPATNEFVCTGLPACDDGIACTEDICNSSTGLCSNQPLNCDDGNPCTDEICEGGFCDYRDVFGVACDDGDPCTTDEICTQGPLGGAVCRGQEFACADNDECTLDECHPVLGSCDFVQVPIGPAMNLLFDEVFRLRWDDGSQPPVTTHYNTYRGTIPRTGFAGGRAIYDHVCFESADSFQDGAVVTTDSMIPQPGTGFYYDVTREGRCGEGPLGSDSSGQTRPLLQACPTPP